MTMSNAKVPVVEWYYRLHEVTGYSSRSSQKKSVVRLRPRPTLKLSTCDPGNEICRR